MMYIMVERTVDWIIIANDVHFSRGWPLLIYYSRENDELDSYYDRENSGLDRCVIVTCLSLHRVLMS
jgi:hypothetical protein